MNSHIITSMTPEQSQSTHSPIEKATAMTLFLLDQGHTISLEQVEKIATHFHAEPDKTLTVLKEIMSALPIGSYSISAVEDTITHLPYGNGVYNPELAEAVVKEAITADNLAQVEEKVNEVERQSHIRRSQNALEGRTMHTPSPTFDDPYQEESLSLRPDHKHAGSVPGRNQSAEARRRFEDYPLESPKEAAKALGISVTLVKYARAHTPTRGTHNQEHQYDQKSSSAQIDQDEPGSGFTTTTGDEKKNLNLPTHPQLNLASQDQLYSAKVTH